MENKQERCSDTKETHTVELLKECSTGCQMAQKSVKQVRSFVTDEKLSELMEAYGEKHSGLEREVAAMLGSYGSREEEPPKMAEIGAWMSVEMGMMMHPNNEEAAKKMMDGCNMGIQSVSFLMTGAVSGSSTLTSDFSTFSTVTLTSSTVPL